VVRRKSRENELALLCFFSHTLLRPIQFHVRQAATDRAEFPNLNDVVLITAHG
jgi:hypothetical protein